jgi:hypothetical protein
MGATATRTGAGAPAGSSDWPRSSLAALAALATAWTLSLLVASAVLVFSGRHGFDLGRGRAFPALVGFAAVYCGVLAVLLRSRGGLHPLATAAVTVVVVAVCLPGPNVAAGAAGLIAVAALATWGTGPPGLSLTAALSLGGAGAAVLAVALAAVVDAPRPRALAQAPPRADAAPARTIPAPSPTPAPTVPLATKPAVESPIAVVRAYYRALDQHDFAAAWARLSPAVRTAFGGYAAWRAGYATTLSSRPSEITVTARGSDTIALRHRLDALDRGPAGPRRASFVVDWRLTRTESGWVATGLSARFE